MSAENIDYERKNVVSLRENVSYGHDNGILSGKNVNFRIEIHLKKHKEKSLKFLRL